MHFAMILKNLKMKFSTLAALMATTTAVKITQSEPSYEISGTLTLEGEGAPAHHEGPDMNDDLAEADKSPSVSEASVHNPLQNIVLEHQNFHVGGQLDIMTNEGPMGKRFDIRLIEDDNNLVTFDIRGKEWDNCLVINEKKNGQWQTEMRYCPHNPEDHWDSLMDYGAEIQLQFLEDGVAMRFWGHHINQDFADVFAITGRPAGHNTYNTRLNFDKLNKVTVSHATGAHIIEAAMQ